MTDWIEVCKTLNEKKMQIVKRIFLFANDVAFLKIEISPVDVSIDRNRSENTSTIYRKASFSST